MCGINAVGAQGSGCMFTLCHAPKKMAVLLHKTENVCRVMNTAVGKDGNIHYYTHLCDVCCRLRNAYSPHMGANCEIIVEIDKMTNTKLNYNSKLLTTKKQR